MEDILALKPAYEFSRSYSAETKGVSKAMEKIRRTWSAVYYCNNDGGNIVSNHYSRGCLAIMQSKPEPSNFLLEIFSNDEKGLAKIVKSLDLD